MREQVILECTEAAKEGKSASRYFTTKNKKLQQERIEPRSEIAGYLKLSCTNSPPSGSSLGQAHRPPRDRW